MHKSEKRGRPLAFLSLRLYETNSGIGRLPPSGFSPDRLRYCPWDGVDRLNLSKALVLVAHADTGATENQLAEEVQSEHDANANPVAEGRSVEQRHSQPVPQKHENPALKAEHSKYNAQSKDNAEDKDEGAEQATAMIVDVVDRVFHSFLIPFLFDD